MYTLGLTCVLVYINTNKCNSQVTSKTTIITKTFLSFSSFALPESQIQNTNNGGNEDEAFRGGFGCDDSVLCSSTSGCSG